MEKTIHFNITPGLILAATAYARRNAFFVLFALLCIAVASTAAGCLAISRGNSIAAWCLFGVSFFAVYFFICLQLVLRKPENRVREHAPIATHITFTDDGFAKHNEVEDITIAWSDLIRVRTSPVFWALHCMHERREIMIVIPSDAISGEIGQLIDSHASRTQ